MKKEIKAIIIVLLMVISPLSIIDYGSMVDANSDGGEDKETSTPIVDDPNTETTETIENELNCNFTNDFVEVSANKEMILKDSEIPWKEYKSTIRVMNIGKNIILSDGFLDGYSSLMNISCSEDSNYSFEKGLLKSKDGTTLIRCLEGNLEDYVIDDNITSIEDGAFNNCVLKEIYVLSTELPEGLKDIPSDYTIIINEENQSEDSSNNNIQKKPLYSISTYGVTTEYTSAFEGMCIRYTPTPKTISVSIDETISVSTDSPNNDRRHLDCSPTFPFFIMPGYDITITGEEETEEDSYFKIKWGHFNLDILSYKMVTAIKSGGYLDFYVITKDSTPIPMYIVDNGEMKPIEGKVEDIDGKHLQSWTIHDIQNDTTIVPLGLNLQITSPEKPVTINDIPTHEDDDCFYLDPNVTWTSDGDSLTFSEENGDKTVIRVIESENCVVTFEVNVSEGYMMNVFITIEENKTTMTEGGIEYLLDLDTKTATIIDYNGNGTELVIPSTIRYTDGTDYTISTIPGEVFSGNESITTLVAKNGISRIESGSFLNCTNLGYIVIESGIITIKEYAFQNVDLKKIKFESETIDQTTIEKNAFYNINKSYKDHAIVYSNNINLNIDTDEGVFEYRLLIQSKEFIDIDDFRFIIDRQKDNAGNYRPSACVCSYIGSGDVATIPGSIEITLASSDTSISIPVESIGSGDLKNKTLKELTIPEECTTIDSSFFDQFLSIEKYIVMNENNILSTDDGVLIFNSSILRYPVMKTDLTFKIGVGISSIDHSAFKGNNYIQTIEVDSEGRNTITICDYAFQGCSKLRSIDLTRVEEIAGYAFDGCTSLDSITISSEMKSIDDTAFVNTGLTEIIVSNNTSFSTTTDNKSLFVTTSESQKKLLMVIDDGDGLYSISDDVYSVSDYAFYNSRVSSIIIGANVGDIRPEMFINSTITSVSVSESNKNVVTDGRAVIENGMIIFVLPGDENYTIPDNAVRIGRLSFSNSRITTLTVPVNIEGMVEGGFDDFGTLKRLIVESESFVIFGYSVKCCESLEFILIPHVEGHTPDPITSWNHNQLNHYDLYRYWNKAEPRYDLLMKNYEFLATFSFENEGQKVFKKFIIDPDTKEELSESNINGISSIFGYWELELPEGEQKKFTITYRDQYNSGFSGSFDENDGHPTTHTYGTDTTLVDPKREYYTFGGWFLNENCEGKVVKTLSSTDYDKDIVLYAYWIGDEFTITFSGSGLPEGVSVPEPIKTRAGTSVNLNPLYCGNGYRFDGWFLNDGTNMYPAFTMPTNDIELVSKWTKQYSVTINITTDSTTTTETTWHESGERICVPYNDITGYGKKISISPETVELSEDNSITVTENITVDVTYTKGTYSLRYMLEGIVLDEDLIPFGTDVELRGFDEIGYEFHGWKKDGITITDLKMPAEDVTLHADAELKQYSISYYINNNQESITKESYNQTITLPPVPGERYTSWESKDVEIIDGQFVVPDKDVRLDCYSILNVTIPEVCGIIVEILDNTTDTVRFNDSFSFRIQLEEGSYFDNGTGPIVTYNNGHSVTPGNDGQYVIQNIQEDITICISGVSTTTYPVNLNGTNVSFKIEINDEPKREAGIGTFYVEYGTRMTVYATPLEWYVIEGWEKTDEGVYFKIFDSIKNPIEINVSAKKVEHTVSINADNASIRYSIDGTSFLDYIGVITIEHGTELTVEICPEEHYVVEKWNDGYFQSTRTITVNKDMSLTANVTKEKFKVIIETDGGTIDDENWSANSDKTVYTRLFSYGDTLKMPVVLKESEQNVGWYPAITENMVVTSEMTFEPLFKDNYFSIKWCVDGVVIDTTNVPKGVIPTHKDPSKTDGRYDYEFIGWTPALTTAVEDTVYTASFNSTPKVFKIELAYNGGTTTETFDGQYTYGTTTKLPSDVTKIGYSFEGWSANPDSNIGEVSSISNEDYGNKKYYAIWSPNTDTKYDVVYYQESLMGEFTEINSETKTGTTGELTSFDIKDIDGFEVRTFSHEEINADGSTVISIYYDRKTITITYQESENSSSSVTGKYGSTITAPSDPTREGYSFNGWEKTLKTFPSENTTIKATWNEWCLTISFNPGESSGTMNNQKIMFSDENKTLSQNTFTKTGYTFNQWTSESGTYSDRHDVGSLITAVDSSLSLTASWTPNTDTVYTVYHSFEKTDGTAYEVDGTKTEKKTGTTDTDTVASALDIDGFTPKNITQTKISGDGSTVVTIEYDRKTTTVSFNTDSGNTIGSVSGKYGTDIPNIEAPTKEGYTFGKWNPVLTTFPSADIELKAEWTINKHKVTFKQDDTTLAEIEVDFGSKITIPTTLIREGYSVSYSPEIPESMPDNALTISVTYTIKQYTITFDSDGGSEVQSITLDYGAPITAPENPTKSGYTFSGWDKTIPATMPAENMTIKAKWTSNYIPPTTPSTPTPTPTPTPDPTPSEPETPVTPVEPEIPVVPEEPVIPQLPTDIEDGTHDNEDGSTTTVTTEDDGSKKVVNEKPVDNGTAKEEHTFDKEGNYAGSVITTNTEKVTDNGNIVKTEAVEIRNDTGVMTSEVIRTEAVSQDGSIKTSCVTENDGAGASTTVSETIITVKTEEGISKVDDDTVAKAIVQMTEISGKEATNVVTLTADTKENETAKVAVSPESMKAISEAGAEMKVGSSTMTVSLTKDVVDNLSSKGGDVSVSIGHADKTTLTENQLKKVGDAPVLSLSASVGEESVHQLGGKVTVTVPYELREGENPNSVKVYYVDDDGNLTQMVTKYDPATRTVSFETNHFSYYMIGSESDAPASGSDNTLLYACAAIAIVAVLAAALFISKRNKAE